MKTKTKAPRKPAKTRQFVRLSESDLSQAAGGQSTMAVVDCSVPLLK